METLKRSAHYQVVNSLGQIVKTFGKDFQAAKDFAKKTDDCGGLWCGLRVKRYYIKSANLCPICKCMPCECEDPNIPF